VCDGNDFKPSTSVSSNVGHLKKYRNMAVLGLRTLFVAFMGALFLLTFGGFIERYASSSNSTL
jgi:hypothetical protein